MSDARDESDRLLVAWSVHTDPDAPPRDGTGLDMTTIGRVPTPEDIVSLRRTDPAEVKGWRARTRDGLAGSLETGKTVVGFTRDGDYLIGAAP